MSTYAIAAGAVGVYKKTLVANVVDEVDFEATHPVPSVEILSGGTAEIWVTLDGSTPTVGGANTWYIPAVENTVRLIPEPWTSGEGKTVVKLLSTGTPTYSVNRGA